MADSSGVVDSDGVHGIEQCPGCKVDLRAGRPRLGRQPTRTIAMVLSRQTTYPGALYWACPDCGHAWHRWPPGDPLRRLAAPYVGED